MKSLIRHIVIIALLFNLSFFISINAFANITPHNNNVLREKTYDEYFKIYDGETTTECGEYVLSKKLTIYKDSTVNHNSTLYLKKDAILIIKKGSTLTVNGTIIVEDGAKLYITDGSVKINNICNNYGKIIIRKRGKMIITGKYISNAFSQLKLEGDAKFGKISLKKTINRIQNVDSKLGINNCCFNYFGVVDRLEVYYRMGNVITDYCYTISPTSSIKNLQVKDRITNKVYDADLIKKINNAVKKYISDTTSKRFADNKYCFDINVNFSYSFKTNTLNYEDSYFEFFYEIDDDDDVPENGKCMWYEQYHEDVLKF